MPAKVISLHSYPIKGLSACNHNSVELIAGEGFPGDRMFGFAKANSGFDPKKPQPLTKDSFIVLSQHAKLAGLDTNFDAVQQILTIKRDKHDPMQFNMTASNEQQKACDFLVELLDLRKEEKPFFASAHPHRFTDVSVLSKAMMNAVSIINLDSVKAFEQKIDQKISVTRFRANIIIEGLKSFSELDMVGEEITIGGIKFKIVQRTQRCAATQVNPKTTERDLELPYLLRKAYGHMDIGIYAEVMSTGKLKTTNF